MSNQYFGVEINHDPLSSTTVQMRAASTRVIIGTAPIHEIFDSAKARKPYINQFILIQSEADIAAKLGPDIDGFSLPSACDSAFDEMDEDGIGTILCINVFDPDIHKDSEGKPDVTKITNADIMGNYDATGNATGIKLAYTAYNNYGFFPKIVDAPLYEHLEGVKEELIQLCERTRARTFLNAPFGVRLNDVIQARGTSGGFDFATDNLRALLCWPAWNGINFTTGKEKLIPYSQVFAGVMMRNNMDGSAGFWHSPSNRQIYSKGSPAQQIIRIPGDSQDDTQLTRQNGIVSASQSWGQGYRTEGNRSAGYPTNTSTLTFIHALYTQDILDETLLYYLDRYRDRNMPPQTLDFIEDRINKWLASLSIGENQENPIITDGRFRFDRALTTSDTIAQGWFYYSFEWMHMTIAERVTVNSKINIEMARNPFGLLS